MIFRFGFQKGSAWIFFFKILGLENFRLKWPKISFKILSKFQKLLFSLGLNPLKFQPLRPVSFFFIIICFLGPGLSECTREVTSTGKPAGLHALQASKLKLLFFKLLFFLAAHLFLLILWCPKKPITPNIEQQLICPPPTHTKNS